MKDQTERTITNVLDFMKSLPHEHAAAFAEEIIFAVTLESGNRYESIGILDWVRDSIIDAYKHKADETVDSLLYLENHRAEMSN